jgi:hypothetical protein
MRTEITLPLKFDRRSHNSFMLANATQSSRIGSVEDRQYRLLTKTDLQQLLALAGDVDRLQLSLD